MTISSPAHSNNIAIILILYNIHCNWYIIMLMRKWSSCIIMYTDTYNIVVIIMILLYMPIAVYFFMIITWNDHFLINILQWYNIILYNIHCNCNIIVLMRKWSSCTTMYTGAYNIVVITMRLLYATIPLHLLTVLALNANFPHQCIEII